MIKLENEAQLETLKAGDTVLYFTANWCSDCRFIEPFLPSIEDAFPNLQFVEIDRDEFLDVCIAHDITGIPSFIVYQNNEVKGSFISKLRKSKEEIIDFIQDAISK